MIGIGRVARLAPVLLSLLVVILVIQVPAVAGDEDPELRAALRQRDWSRASELLEARLADDAHDAAAWADLALVRYRQERYPDAATAGLEAARLSPGRRPAMLYDVACFQSLAGETDAARESLRSAYAAGFVNYDLLFTDPDLDALRPHLGVDLPAEHAYERFRAPNGVELGYRIELPRGYDPSRTYPGVVTFAPGGWGPRSSDWAITHLWGDPSELGLVVVHLVAPDGGWLSHPAHHALEDLLDEVLATHAIANGRFHLTSLGQGCRVATTYASMSRRYVDGVTLVNSTAWSRWDDDEIAGVPDHRYTFVVGEANDAAVDDVARALPILRAADREVEVEILPGEGVLPPSMLDGGLLRFIAGRLDGNRAQAVR